MNILAIGAHPDDIEIGCGGALALHAKQGDIVTLVTLSAGEKGGAEAEVRLKEARHAAEILGAKEYLCLNYPDTAIPSSPDAITKLDELIKRIQPQRVYVPFIRELHQDHRHTAEVALAASRNIPQVLMYEGPSTYPDFVVSYYMNIEATIDQKIQAIEAHVSQGPKEILKSEAIRSLNRFRGYQARARYAEGFSVFRFIENPPTRSVTSL